MDDPAERRLAAAAHAALGEPALAIEPLAHSTRHTPTRGVYRVQTATRTVVAKTIAREFRDATAPDDVYYAPREPQLYDRGLPRAYIEAGIATPALLGLTEDDDAVTLWLAHAEGDSGAALTPGHFERTAQRLGRAQGTAPDAGASRSWSRNFLPVYLAIWDDVGWERIYDDQSWDQPLVRDHFSPDLQAKLVALCEARHTMLAWADALPQTICHHDVWPNNVFDRADRTVLIDWAFAGWGAVGCDAGNLVTDACGDLLLPPTLLPELDAAATAGYKAGLADAGWRGDDRMPRLGMCLMAAKWSWLTPHMLRLAADSEHAIYGQGLVASDTIFAARSAMLDYLTTMAAEAHMLASELKLRSG